MNGSHNSSHLINYKCNWPLSHCFVDNFRDNIIYHVFEKFFIIYCHFYRLQNEVCKGYVFTGVCLSTGESLGLCPGGSPSRWDFRPEGFLSGGISVQGVSVQVDTCPGVFVRETSHMVTSGWYTPYWNALLYDIITLKIPTASGRKPSNIQS